MGIFASFATGFLQGSVDAAREKKLAQIEADKLAQERRDSLGGIIFDLIKDDKLTGAEGAALLGKPDLTRGDIAGMVNTMADAAGTQKFGDYKLNLTAEYDYKSMSGFDRSQIFWDSWDKQLGTEDGFQQALAYFENNEQARNALANAVRRNEYELRVGNINRQKKANVELSGLQYIDLPNQYGNASRLFDELGFQNVSEEADKAIAESIIDFDPETEVAVLMNTRQSGGAMEPVAVGVDKQTYALWGEMAANSGYGSVQSMVADFSVDAGFREVDETREQFAFRQNDLLTKAAKLYGEGMGDFLANPALADAEKAQTYLKKLSDITGGNREQQIQIMSMLVKTPANVFTKTRKNRYAGTSSQRVRAELTGEKFVERVSGLTVADFNEGFRAQEDAVEYLDRLQELENELGEQVGTGWIRTFAATAKRFGIQLEQGKTTLANLFRTNGDFAETAKDVSMSDLQATIAEVRPDINLEDISEVDALRLTLAAKMARAIDPSGRLSNQDFEVQLRRLGDGPFDTPKDIARKLAVVRKDFEKDLLYKRRLKSVMDDQTALTPQVARTVQASLRLRNIEKQVYGVKGRDAIIGADQQVTAPVIEEPTGKDPAQPLPSYGDTGFYGPKDGKFYKDPEGTQEVSPAEFRAATQPKQGA